MARFGKHGGCRGGPFEKLLAESIPVSSKTAGQSWANHLYNNRFKKEKFAEIIVSREEWGENMLRRTTLAGASFLLVPMTHSGAVAGPLS